MKKKLSNISPVDDSFSDKWATYKYLSDVKSDIREDITSDFIFAKLNENQRESVTELVRDAYFVKKEIEKLMRGYTYRAGNNGKYLKNTDGTYKTYPLTKDVQSYIKRLAKITFNSYMVKIIMTMIMYRNIENNVLVELITEKDKLTAESDEMRRENERLSERVRENIKKGVEDK